MIAYSLIVTLFLGILITPVVQNFRAMRNQERAEAMRNHPSSGSTLPFNVIDHTE